MHRIDTATKALDLFGPGKHGHTLGDPEGDQPATNTSADQFNAWQEEIGRALEFFGIPLDKTNNQQLAGLLRGMLESNWLSEGFGESADIRAVFYQSGAGLWVAVLSDGGIARSADGFVFRRVAITSSDDYGPGTVTDDNFTPDAAASPAWVGGAYAQKYFIDSAGNRWFIEANSATAGGDHGTLDLDGTPTAGAHARTAIVEPYPIGGQLNDIVGGISGSANVLLVVGVEGRLYRTTNNGVTWSVISPVVSSDVAAGSGTLTANVFDVGGMPGWTNNAFVGKFWIDANGARWPIVANDSNTLTVDGAPPDGTHHNWQVITPITKEDLHAVLDVPNMGQLAVGDNATFLSSGNTSSWTARTFSLGFSAHVKKLVALAHNYDGAVSSADARYHVLLVNNADGGGDNGFVLGPINADFGYFDSQASWHDAPAGFTPRSAAWHVPSSRWIVVGSGGKVYASPHNLVGGWTLQATLGGNLTQVRCANGGVLLACGDDGALFTSVDGIHWTRRFVPGYSGDFLGAAYGGSGYWLVTGEAGLAASCLRI
jgi:hypothetical protein